MHLSFSLTLSPPTMASLSLFPSLSTKLSLTETLNLSSPSSKTHFNFPSHSYSLSSHRLLSSPHRLSSGRLPFVAKFSETEATVIEAVEEEAEIEGLQVGESSMEEAKREEIFAVVMIGGRQYIVFPGRFIHTQRFKGAKVDDKVILNKVLLVGTKNSTYLGKPLVPNAVVHAVIEEQGLNKKVVVFKYKKKKGYRRNIGHRQPNTRLRILGITGYENAPVTTLEE